MPKIREMRRSDLEAVSSLGIRSKATWGYEAEAMAVFAEELTLELPDLDRFLEAEVAVDGEGKVVGYFTLVARADGVVELEHLFVHPEHFGKGIGSQLLARALGMARQRGAEEVTILSDPQAVEFYLRKGARQVDHHISSIPGRTIPVLQIPTPSEMPPD